MIIFGKIVFRVLCALLLSILFLTGIFSIAFIVVPQGMLLAMILSIVLSVTIHALIDFSIGIEHKLFRGENHG